MSTQPTRPLPWWITPLACIAVGTGLALVHLLGDEPGAAAKSFLFMAAIAGALAAGGRSEAVRALRGEDRDERTAQIDLRAASAMGLALVVAVVAMTLFEWANRRSGSPYIQLVAIGAAAYVIAGLWARRRM